MCAVVADIRATWCCTDKANSRSRKKPPGRSTASSSISDRRLAGRADDWGINKILGEIWGNQTFKHSMEIFASGNTRCAIYSLFLSVCLYILFCARFHRRWTSSEGKPSTAGKVRGKIPFSFGFCRNRENIVIMLCLELHCIIFRCFLSSRTILTHSGINYYQNNRRDSIFTEKLRDRISIIIIKRI